MSQYPKEWLYRWGSLILGAVLLMLYLILPRPAEVVKAGLLAAALVFLLTALERLWLWETIKEQLKEAASEALKPQLVDAKDAVSQLVRDMNVEHAKWVRGLASDVNELVRAAEGCGLKGIYVDRLDSACRDGESRRLDTELLKKVGEANDRVWLLGIAFSEGIELPELVNVLVEKKERELDALSKNPVAKKLDVRILLLDPLRSTSVFRTLLESPLGDVAKIVGADTGRGPDQDFLLNTTTLYRHANEAYAVLASCPNQILESSVKFYAHNPMCWLVIIDDLAYFEPYTFGKPDNLRESDRCLGPHMPVFRFSPGRILEILTSHFDRMWLTSDVGMIHYGARNDDAHVWMGKLFKQRLPWLRRAYDALSWRERNKDMKDRRYPRYACESERPTALSVAWTDEKGSRVDDSLTAVVLNSSRTGISLKMTGFHADRMPKRGEHFNIAFAGDAAQTSATEKILLLPFIGSDLEVKWSRQVASAPDGWSVGLWKNQRRHERCALSPRPEFEVATWEDRGGKPVEQEFVGLAGEVEDFSPEGMRVTLTGLRPDRWPVRREHFKVQAKGSGNATTAASPLGAFWGADLEVRWAKEDAANPRKWTVGLKRRVDRLETGI